MSATVSRPPSRTDVQRLKALDLANEIRTYRAELKRDLAAGRTTFAKAIDDPRCSTMKVYDLLLAVPKVGRVKANRMLVRCRVSPSKTCGGLSERQRRELLRSRGGR